MTGYNANDMETKAAGHIVDANKMVPAAVQKAVAWQVGDDFYTSESLAIEGIQQWGPSGSIAIPLYAAPVAAAPVDDGMLPDALVPYYKEWYTLCERRFAVDKIKISGDLACAIVDAISARASTPAAPVAVTTTDARSLALEVEKALGWRENERDEELDSLLISAMNILQCTPAAPGIDMGITGATLTIDGKTFTVDEVRTALLDASPKGGSDAGDVTRIAQLEAEVEALRSGIEKAMSEIDDDGPKALKYARQELQAAMQATSAEVGS